MGWYYYSGKVPRAVTVKAGLSKLVRPNTKIEILQETSETVAMIRRGDLRPTGRPAGAGSVENEPITNLAVSIPKSEFASKFAEKGMTKSPGVTPVSKSGVEFTEGEMIVAGVIDSVQTPDQTSDSIAEQADVLPDEFGMRDRKSKKRR